MFLHTVSVYVCICMGLRECVLWEGFGLPAVCQGSRLLTLIQCNAYRNIYSTNIDQVWMVMYIWIQTSYFKESLTNLMQLKLQSYLYLVVSLVIYCMFGNLWKMVSHEFFMVNTAWKKLMLSYLYLWHFKKEIQTYFRDSKMPFVHTKDFINCNQRLFFTFFSMFMIQSHEAPFLNRVVVIRLMNDISECFN